MSAGGSGKSSQLLNPSQQNGTAHQPPHPLERLFNIGLHQLQQNARSRLKLQLRRVGLRPLTLKKFLRMLTKKESISFSFQRFDDRKMEEGLFLR